MGSTRSGSGLPANTCSPGLPCSTQLERQMETAEALMYLGLPVLPVLGRGDKEGS